MKVQIRPELRKFLDDEVTAGRFPSRDAAIEAAVERMKLEQGSDELDDETAAAINRAEEQIDRGEGIDFHEFAAKMRKKLRSS